MSGEGDKGFVFKITVIGDGAVGKTSLIKKKKIAKQISIRL